MNDTITGVPGLFVASHTVDRGEMQTGITAIWPASPKARHRKVHLSYAARGEPLDFTGLPVADDFGTFSSPMLMCSVSAVGAAYDALITAGHRRHPDLPPDDGWPPVVIGLDDGYLNDLRGRGIGHDEILEALEKASADPMEMGSIGVGRGLCAFGGKGGVGSSTKIISIERTNYSLGILVAAGGGRRVLRKEVGATAPSFVVIAATDAPLWPGQLRRAAEAALDGLGVAAPLDVGDALLGLSFSVGNAMDNTVDSGVRVLEQRGIGEDAIQKLLEAIPGVVRDALARALMGASAVRGRKGREVGAWEGVPGFLR